MPQRSIHLFKIRLRQFSKKVFKWNLATNSYLLNTDILFIYYGWTERESAKMVRHVNVLPLRKRGLSQREPSGRWQSNLIHEMETLTNETKSYTWGIDLSGSLQGAGGVGGLLAVVDSETTTLPTYDGNGNIVAYIDGESGDLSAEYEYGPFGEMIRSSGIGSQSQSFTFSTKYADTETKLVYYGYRYYNPELGSWLNRDPIEENGGVNLYGIVKNNPVSVWDILGLAGPPQAGTPSCKTGKNQCPKNKQRLMAAELAVGKANSFLKCHSG